MVVVAAAFLAALIAYRLPSMGVTVTSRQGGPILVLAMKDAPPGIAFPAELIAIRPRLDRGEIVGVDGNDDAVRRSERTLTVRSMAIQDRLAAMAPGQETRLLLRSRSGSPTWVARTVAPTGLRWPFWTDAIAGVLAAAIALWIHALRPGNMEAGTIAVSGVGFAAAALSAAALDNGEFVVGGTLWHHLVMANWTGALIFGGGLIAFFLHFPRPLLASKALRIGLSVMSLAGALATILAISMVVGYVFVSSAVLLIAMAILSLIALQWRRSARDPLGRAALRLIGSATAATLVLFLLTSYLPPLFQRDANWVDGAIFLQILPLYIAIAITVMRGEFLDLDRWAWGLAASAVVTILLLVTDVSLALMAGLSPAPALSIAILLIAAGWIVVRQQLFQRWFRFGPRDGSLLLGRAGHVVLADSADQQFVRWQEALSNFFDPLEMTIHPDGPGRVERRQNGLELVIPAPTFGRPLRLRAARRGRSLFRSEDCMLVETFSNLCEQAETDRRAYDRGTEEERRRIARDLHDDISARLLTSLHRDDFALVKSDVRGALHEIRSLVSILQNDMLTIAEMLGAARHDAGERLQAAGIELDWPVLESEAGDRPLPIAAAKSIERAIRESITNAIRHSEASKVSVACSVDDADGLSVIVADNGLGLDPHETAGNGLRNIRQRLSELGGTAEISNARPERPGGVLVRLILPLATTP
jgi:signal transduction histidine kinase